MAPDPEAPRLKPPGLAPRWFPPPPQFLARKAGAFASTPPAIFPVILGMLGLGLALRTACASFDLGAVAGLVEAALGALFGLWLFAVLALVAKILRRPAVLREDLRPLPGRAGLGAATISGMAAAGVLTPYAPGLAVALIFAALLAHGVMALLLIRVMIAQGAEGLVPNPTWHLSFGGFIVAAPVLALMGWTGSAAVILCASVPVACAIWALSVGQLVRRIPPAPLRPMLALHLTPAALLSITAALLGHDLMAQIFAALALGVFLALLATARWLLQGGFTPIWGDMTFPLATLSTALLMQGGTLAIFGAALAVLALPFVGIIAWKVLKLWPGGRLAARTNAAVA